MEDEFLTRLYDSKDYQMLLIQASSLLNTRKQQHDLTTGNTSPSGYTLSQSHSFFIFKALN